MIEQTEIQTLDHVLIMACRWKGKNWEDEEEIKAFGDVAFNPFLCL